MKLPGPRRLQRLASWIATFAILMATLAPTVSQALVVSGLAESDWVEICSAQGTRWINAAEEAPERQPAQAHAEVCPYCFTHAGSFGLAPPADATTDPFAGDRYLPVPIANDPPRVANVWFPYQTRAPPLIA